MAEKTPAKRQQVANDAEPHVRGVSPHFVGADAWREIQRDLRLSPMEAAVAALLCDDLGDNTSDFAIGVRLGISPHTAHRHRRDLFGKLMAHSARQAVSVLWHRYAKILRAHTDAAQ